MAFKVKYSEQSVDDLADIISYISDKLCNPRAAERFFIAVTEKTELIGENPYMYPFHHDKKLRAEGYRFAVVGNYLLFYVIDDGNSIVNIIRIVYGKRNLSVIFEE